ncbi:MAG: dTDP-4-dehydrorhamnose 3,5-epimerase [Thermodesulfobacteriota bacterium]
MSVKLIDSPIKNLLVLKNESFSDSRGYFKEIYHTNEFIDVGINKPFLQDNLSHSRNNVLRGLHYQLKHPQGKLIQVISGEIFDVAVDIRKGSPTFGKWFGISLSEENNMLLYVPEGFAHGFCVTSNTAHVYYKCTDIYYSDDQYGIIWNDPDIKIKWPVDTPSLSAKDSDNPYLSELSVEELPTLD